MSERSMHPTRVRRRRVSGGKGLYHALAIPRGLGPKGTGHSVGAIHVRLHRLSDSAASDGYLPSSSGCGWPDRLTIAVQST